MSKLAELVLELAEAVDNARDDIGGSRGQLDILREAVQVAQIEAVPVAWYSPKGEQYSAFGADRPFARAFSIPLYTHGELHGKG